MKLLFICIYLIVLIGIPLFEHFIKRKIKNNKYKTLPYCILKGNVKIHYSTNTGMMLGFLKNKKNFIKIITIILVLILFGFSIYILLFEEYLYILKVGLALLSGGALSNAIERLFKGFVIDYFSFPKFFIKKVRRVIFNFADIAIFLGCLICLIGVFL